MLCYLLAVIEIMSSLWYFNVVFCVRRASIAVAIDDHAIAASTNLLQDHDESYDSYHQNIMNDTKASITLLLPMEITESIAGYLEIMDLRALMRSCKCNLLSCKQYIRTLLSRKFHYFLTGNRLVNIDGLLQIPLINSISINASDMAFYFANSRKMTSKYIGIDAITDNAFISFWLQSISIPISQWKVVTVIFNHTNIECIYVSDSSSFRYPWKTSSFKSDLTDIQIFNNIIISGKISSILGDNQMYCLYEQWEACMFWPRIRAKIKWNYNTINKRKCCVWGCPIFLVLFLLVFAVAKSRYFVTFMLGNATAFSQVT